ncbi:hypothetical protein H257_12725 [Aphanomyces astaci]|uniref:Serine protease n=2 Tax=Aphanomyces astaci TaxID=112090 RepID=W4FXP8_APHAT|nr:hypothetical protein H257_12725 [Aphanomyces astaci]ETV72262.1 hypothetical protein H257_12725 [Aphanomyces astaci]RQM30829.1 hypothetical protein B5M09_013187 [Aphanomyces astaci]|eukprot:XP_009838330.1 hypothetical protein H257_12725 [Aphanomyces astaci]
MVIHVIALLWCTLAVTGHSSFVPERRTLGCTNVAVSSSTFVISSNPYSSAFLALRFSAFSLAPNDYVVLRSVDDSTIPRVYLFANESLGIPFDAPPISSTRVEVSLVVAPENNAHSPSSCVQVSGYTSELARPPTNEAVCGLDRTQEAVCYRMSAPTMFNKSNAVARLVINKGGVLTGCTGWLLGSEGHLVTNNHCIEDASQIVGLRIEFMAQTSKCPQSIQDKNCMRQLACVGDAWRGDAAVFIYTNKALDYTLIQLRPSGNHSPGNNNNNVATKYGYLQLRATGPEINEPIYIVEHPQAWGKRISDKTATGRAVVTGLNAFEAEYYLDTQAMSSGSPVLAVEDDAVIALHHAAYSTCPNLGVKSDLIVADLVAQNLVPQDAVLWKPRSTGI